MTTDRNTTDFDRTVRTVDGEGVGLLFLAGNALRRKGNATELPAVEYRLDGHRLDAARLIAYQKLCGFTVSSTVPSDLRPCADVPAVDGADERPRFSVSPAGLVHVHNRITQVRPIDSAESLDLRVWAGDLRDHPAGAQVDIRAEAASATRRCGAGRAPTCAALPDPQRAARARRRATSPRRRVLAAAGRPGPSLRGRVRGPQPDPPEQTSAKAFGFPRAIAHGMWLNARVLGAMESRLPAAYTIDVAFKTPTFLPSTVAFDANRTDDGWTLGVRHARNGKPHLFATIAAQP